MQAKAFLNYLVEKNCTYQGGKGVYTAVNHDNGRSSTFAKSGGDITADTVKSVCAELGISVPSNP